MARQDGFGGFLPLRQLVSHPYPPWRIAGGAEKAGLRSAPDRCLLAGRCRSSRTDVALVLGWPTLRAPDNYGGRRSAIPGLRG